MPLASIAQSSIFFVFMHAVSRAGFDAAVAALDARIPSLDRGAIIVELARLLAMNKNQN